MTAPEVPEPLDDEAKRRLGESLAAFDLLLDSIVTARQYFAGERNEDPVVDRCAEVLDQNYAWNRARRSAGET